MFSLFSFLDSCCRFVGILYNVPKTSDALFIFLISLDWMIPIIYVQGHLFFLPTWQICCQHLKTIRLLSCPEVIFVRTAEYLISNLQSVLNSFACTLYQFPDASIVFHDTVESLFKAIYSSLISRISLLSFLACHSPDLKLQSCSRKPVHSNPMPSLLAGKVTVFLSFTLNQTQPSLAAKLLFFIGCPRLVMLHSCYLSQSQQMTHYMIQSICKSRM